MISVSIPSKIISHEFCRDRHSIQVDLLESEHLKKIEEMKICWHCIIKFYETHSPKIHI